MKKKHNSSLIIISGIDGCGKTTVLRKLSENYPRYKIIKWSELTNTHIKMQKLTPEYVNTLSPMGRALIFGSVAWEMYDKILQFAFDEKKIMIIDSYYYKYLARELEFGQTDPILSEIFFRLPNPELVVFIDTNPSDIVLRKELNIQEKKGRSLADAVAFQTAVRNRMLELIPDDILEIVSGNGSPDQVYNDVFQKIENCLEKS